MVVSDGLASYRGIQDRKHVAKVVGKMAAHILLPWIHRVFSNFKRWALRHLATALPQDPSPALP